MLILNSSDKGEREELVTGKFGLGFKSVFFLTDRPQVASGDLAFEVRGGFFPVPLPPERAADCERMPLARRAPAGRHRRSISRFEPSCG